MKLNSIISESFITENTAVAEDVVVAVHELENIMEDISTIRTLMKEDALSEEDMAEIVDLLGEMDEIASSADMGDILEAVTRQFKRYGDKFLRQYRCSSGQKAGRMVTSPEKCGIRKDPRRVRIGKKSARVKKGQRVRKTLFTKRKTQSKRLSRMNKTLRGDK